MFWGHLWCRRRSVFYSDNGALVFILNKRCSSNAHIMLVMRRLSLLFSDHNLHLVAIHVLGTSTYIVGALSRQQWSRFHCLAPWGEPFSLFYASPLNVFFCRCFCFPHYPFAIRLLSVADFSSFRSSYASPRHFLRQGVRQLWQLAFSPSTRNSYSIGLKEFSRFLHFRSIHHPFHRCFTKSVLQEFTSYCFYLLHWRATSICSYLLAIHSHCLRSGFSDPLRSSNGQVNFSLFTLLRAVENYQASPRSSRLPIDAIPLFPLYHFREGS